MGTVSAKQGSRVVLGIVVLVLGVTCNAIGIGLVANPKDADDPSAGWFWVVFSVIAMVLPGILLVLAGRKQARRVACMETIVALSRASQRLPLAQLAEELKLTPADARALLLEAIGQHRIFGRLDLEQGVFISASTHGGVQQLTMNCRNCGGRSEVIVSAASTSHCQYCGFRLA
jgi:hypothetical protein